MSKSVTFCEKKEVFMVIEIYNQLKLSENLTEVCVAFQSGKKSEKKKNENTNNYITYKFITKNLIIYMLINHILV